MTVHNMLHSPSSASRKAKASNKRVIDLGGSALHVFHFAERLDYAYEYFADIPTVCKLLPDTLDVQTYAPDNYRLIVGANDGMGHTMAAVFDIHADCVKDQYIRLAPATDGPVINISGLSFRGDFWGEALFKTDEQGTTVEYSLEIGLSIPLPGILATIPQDFLQNMGERGMGLKMSHMIDGFARDLEHDFSRWLKVSHPN